MGRPGIEDPTEETWRRTETFDAAGYFVTWSGRYGPWTFTSFGEENRWSEAEMAAVDALMRRVCDIDRAYWRFHRYRGEQYSHRFTADAPTWRQPGCLSMDLGEFLYKIEMNWLQYRVERWDYVRDQEGNLNGEQTAKHCKWCPRIVRSPEIVRSRSRSGRAELWMHIQEEHPTELQAVRDAREAELEELRGFYRRKDARYNEQRDGPRHPRPYIL